MALDLNFSITSLPTVLPRIVGDPTVGQTWSLDETGLTGITARQWSVVGGANLGTAATQDTTGYSGEYLQCTVTCDQGVLTTPSRRVYEATMMVAVDVAATEICKHEDATKYAVQDGLWTDPEIWNAATVPTTGDHVVIPKGRTVTYNVASSSPRFDSIRVDGKLAWALDQNTDMLVEHLIVSRGGEVEIGTPGNRLPAAYTATITISGTNCAVCTELPTDMDVVRDPELWGRGFIVMGSVVIWGKDVLHGAFATEGRPAGSTNLVLESAPTGWQVGDTIVICPTAYTNAGPATLFHDVTQEEERVITDITGNTITWSGGLTFNHNDRSTTGNNKDVRPYVFLKNGRNVVIKSEVTTPSYRRGHFSAMHGLANVDIWQAAFIDMGRTDKSTPLGSGVKDSEGFFRTMPYADVQTLNATQSRLIRLDDGRVPIVGKNYYLGFFGTDADSSSFVAGSYTNNNDAQPTSDDWVGYFAQEGDTWEDVAAGIAARFVVWNGLDVNRSTSILNITADPEGLRLTSSVTDATDTIAVTLLDQIWRFPFNAQSNLQGRYNLHLHHIGTNPTVVPQIVGCYAEGTPGWAMVHHFAKADFRECVTYKFWGAGLVGESGDELGQWFDCVSCKSTNNVTNLNGLRSRAKTNEGFSGEASDMGRFGWGMLSRSRALVYNNCKTFACPTGFVFFHRENPAADSVGETRNLTRADIDLQTPTFWTRVGGSDTTFNFEDYPIVHFEDNLSAGCLGSLFITKVRGTQNHDFAIQLSRFTSWGSEQVAAEYIQHYNFVNSYSIPANSWEGFTYGGNVYHSGFWQVTVEGSGTGVRFADGLDAESTHNLFDNTNDPRWWTIGQVNIGSLTPQVYSVASGRIPGADVTLVDPDPLSNRIDITLDPTETFPLVVGDYDPRTSTFDPPLDADGKKVDNLSALQQMAPIAYPNANASGGNGPCDGTKGNDEILWRTPGGLGPVGATYGFYTYAGEQVIVTPWVITDRVTGRPACYDKLWRLKVLAGANYSQADIESNPGWTHMGTYVRNANAITGDDIEIRVDPNSTNNVIDVQALANLNQGGVTTGFRLDNTWGTRDFRAPNRGTATVDVANATVTYSPFPKATGVDTMYVLARREGRYKTIAIRILIAATDTGRTTPVVDTHFSAADSATSGAMDITLLARPDTAGRHIDYVEYSTDSGATWRKLVNQWPRTRITVNTASDGTALGTGAKTVMLRYMTDYDYTMSAASGNDSVTVT